MRAELVAHYYRRSAEGGAAEPTVAALLGCAPRRYTTYLSPAAYRAARRALTGRVRRGRRDFVLPAPGGLLVRRTMDGPARIAGVRPGDTIMAVDGASTAALSFRRGDRTHPRPPGQQGDAARAPRRAGRCSSGSCAAPSCLPSGSRAARRHGVGVVRIDAFSRGTATATTSAVAQPDANGREGARARPARKSRRAARAGGRRRVALPASGRERRLARRRAHAAARSSTRTVASTSTIPLAVLVDGGSASASEVVAGALKDHGRGTVIGEPTYGKSLVQEIVRLPSGAALKLTVARYLTPAGVDISRGGVQPDIRSRHALDAAIRLFTARRRSQPPRAARRRRSVLHARRSRRARVEGHRRPRARRPRRRAARAAAARKRRRACSGRRTGSRTCSRRCSSSAGARSQFEPHDAAARRGPDDRTDLRDLLTYTIDPETAKDFDDALSFRREAGRDPRVGAHRRRLVVRRRGNAARPRRGATRILDLRAGHRRADAAARAGRRLSARCGRTRTGSASRSRCRPTASRSSTARRSGRTRGSPTARRSGARRRRACWSRWR